MENELRLVWNRFFVLNWKFGLFLLLIVCVPRFILVLNANETGNYSSIGLMMIVSALVPFIFLNKQGRKQIGIKATRKLHYLIVAIVIGLSLSLLLHYIGQGLYGDSYKNWYVYIGKSYNIPETIAAQDKKVMFIIMAVTAMTFSPIGEELFFRGIVHSSFAKSFGHKKASVIDSLAFSITHLSHFGLVFVNNSWDFYPVPALTWIISMFIVSLLLYQMKRFTHSIWGAVLCHSGFNLGMTYCIFYLL